MTGGAVDTWQQGPFPRVACPVICDPGFTPIIVKHWGPHWRAAKPCTKQDPTAEGGAENSVPTSTATTNLIRRFTFIPLCS